MGLARLVLPIGMIMETKSVTWCIARAYESLIAAAGWLQSPLLLALRLYWGWQFFVTGKAKLMHVSKFAAFFQSIHIPFPNFNVCLAGGTECVGGLLLLLGLGARLVSIPLLVVLIVAYLTAELDAVKAIFSDPDKFVTATPFLFMLACLVVLAFGPGVFSIDWLLAKTIGRKPKS
ncbi:MAG: DoxX family protein, partial [Verrucomicrobiota bacterium]|jgi:putative oxidoreductase